MVALDRNATALQLGAEVCGRYGYPLTVRRHNALQFPLPIEGTFDLVIIGHCLAELFPHSRRIGRRGKMNGFIIYSSIYRHKENCYL